MRIRSIIGARSTVLPVLLCASAVAVATAAEQSYPTKSVRVIVPSAPGGSVDALGRLVSQKLSSALGQQFVVENRAGSGGVSAAKSPPGLLPMVTRCSWRITAT